MSQKNLPQTTAIFEFKKIFKSKTSTDWQNRVGMTTKSGKYTWIGKQVIQRRIEWMLIVHALERSFDDDEDDNGKSNDADGANEEPVKIPDSKLDVSIQTFVKLVFNTQYVLFTEW